MLHDLFANPNPRERAGFPFNVCMQADAGTLEPTIVAPLTAERPNIPLIRVLPRVEHEGQGYLVVLTLMTNLPTRLLRRPVGSIAAWRDDLACGLDWLFFGI
jgi:hypothetical protein